MGCSHHDGCLLQLAPDMLLAHRSGTTEGAGDSTRRRLAHASLLTCIGLRLFDEAIHVTTGYRLGKTICQPHSYVCRAMVEAKGLHGLARRKSAPCHVRYSQLNDVIWRASKKTQIPANNEPVGLSRADRKRPNGANLVPWTRKTAGMGRHSPKHLCRVAHTIYVGLSLCSRREEHDKVHHHHVNPLVRSHRCVKTSGAWCFESAEFIEDLGRRITLITGEPLESTYLFQRISVTLQRGNAVAFHNTFPES